MNVVKIPFVNLLEIKQNETLELSFTKKFTNHLGSMHAGAIYTLAETQSGLFLQESFKEYKNVVAILREGSIKYKKEIKNSAYAVASIEKDTLEKFINRFTKRSQAIIEVNVNIISNNELSASASFSWYVKLN